jgi:SAM-dependent methyltransferase
VGRSSENYDPKTVASFGNEWQRFDQSRLTQTELRVLFDRYFAIFPWDAVSADAVGFDLGCGSGRWARLVAPRVGRLLCVDASSKALEVAKRNLADQDNCEFINASVGDLPIDDASMDFGYALGILHHVPDTAAAMQACVSKLRPGAPFLVYLYYALESRPRWFRLIWRTSNAARQLISKLPRRARYVVTQLIAVFVYFPLARLSKLVDELGGRVNHIPLSSYRDASFYTMRTDALDRFGTPLEQRFTAAQVEAMMTDAGLERVSFSSSVPYWCAVGYRR